MGQFSVTNPLAAAPAPPFEGHEESFSTAGQITCVTLKRLV